MAWALRTVGLGKRYRLGARVGYQTLGDTLSRTAREWFRTPRVSGGHRSASNSWLWALRNVDLEIPVGRAIAIIGSNGAGKTTLLKILSKVTPPTEGRADIRGRVGSLLEVGMGFHPELTGRDNVFLNGAILGMSRGDLVRRFDAIVDFAGVETFLDTPVKHYSTGMYLRLAFAVAAHLEPDVLLVDEVLAVGDAEFQRKCLGKMSEVAGEGRTVILITHSMDAVHRLCREAILLDHGGVAMWGPSEDVVARYLSTADAGSTPNEPLDLRTRPRRGSGEARFITATYRNPSRPDGRPRSGEPLEFALEIDSQVNCTMTSLAVSVLTESGLRLINADIVSLGEVVRLREGRNVVTLRLRSLYLAAGRYIVELWLGHTVGSGTDYIQSALHFEVNDPQHRGFGIASAHASVICDFDFLTA